MQDDLPARVATGERFDGQVAIVTGAASGIGFAVARRLAADGAAVLITDLDAHRARLAADRLLADTAHRAPVSALRVDIRSSDDLARVSDVAVAELGGPPTIVVCNAGIQTFEPALTLKGEEFRDVLDVNVWGTFQTMRMAMRSFQENEIKGAIVAVASILARRPNPDSAHYAASKAAVLSLVWTMAAACAADGIRVNCVAPGAIDTDLWARADDAMVRIHGMQPGEAKRRRLNTIPMQRFGTPDEVAAAVAFLASADASYLTGECIHVCGGDVML